MSRTPCLAGALLAAAAMLAAVGAHAQGRGPTVWQLEGKGQTIEHDAPDPRVFLAVLARENGLDPRELESGQVKLIPGTGWVLQREGEQIVLSGLRRPPEELDESTRASKLAEQGAWLGRLVGRFRIGGRVEKRGTVIAEVVDQPSLRIPTTLGGDVHGIADCAAVGAGPGIHCLINATWPIIEPIRFRPGPPPIEPPEASERVRVHRPAVVVLGLNPDTAEIRASMVTDDSVAHTWAGRLETNTLTARRLTSCFVAQGVLSGSPPPCFPSLEIIAEPDSDIVTLAHNAAGVNIRLILQRDPAARAEKPMESKKVR